MQIWVSYTVSLFIKCFELKWNKEINTAHSLTINNYLINGVYFIWNLSISSLYQVEH